MYIDYDYIVVTAMIVLLKHCMDSLQNNLIEVFNWGHEIRQLCLLEIREMK